MKKKFIISACGLLLLCGCAQENLPLENNNVERGSSNPYRVTLQQALKRSDRLLAQLDGGMKTRAFGRAVADVQIVEQPKTRGINSADTLFYIVNYTNNSGFAVLAADTRLAPVYAISNEGNLSVSDTIGNPGLASFFNSLYADGAGIPTDSVSTGNNDTPPAIDAGYEGFKIGPIVPKNVRCMTDAEVPRVFGDTTEVSEMEYLCLYMMSAYKWPKKIGDHEIDWDVMYNSTVNLWDPSTYEAKPDDDKKGDGKGDGKGDDENNDKDKDKEKEKQQKLDEEREKLYRDLKKMMWDAGVKIDYYITHKGGGSGSGKTVYDCLVYQYICVMESLGFDFDENGDNSTEPFDESGIKTMMGATRPVLLASYSPGTEVYPNYLWATDGWWYFGSHDKNDPSKDIFLLHCLWPKKQQCNGWFKLSGATSGTQAHPGTAEDGEMGEPIEEVKNIRYHVNVMFPKRN